MIGGDSSGGDPCSPQSPHHPHHHPSPHGASSQLYQPHHPGYVTGKAAAGGGFSGVGGGVTTTPLHPHHQPRAQTDWNANWFLATTMLPIRACTFALDL